MYKLGRKPGVIPVGLHDLTFYAAGPLPAPPPSVTVPAVTSPDPDGTPWGVLGNDTEGDCGVAGGEHGFMAAAADTAETESFPTAAQAVSYYRNYTGGQDDGVVLSQYLAYVRANGYYGLTVPAYAPVAVHDVPTLQFAVDAYDFAYTGIKVCTGMMDAVQGTASGWTWTAENLTGSDEGGHCIPVVGYDSQWLYAITWGQVIKIAYPAWHLIADEAWAVLTGEVNSAGTDGHGISLSALTADLAKVNQ